MNFILSPSLLSANFADLASELKALTSAGITWLHLDVMDGVFVPNITFGVPVIKSLRQACGLFFDVHLMIDDPGRHIEAFACAGADLLVPHIEAMTHPQRVLDQIHKLGKKAGIALDPDTDPARLRWLLPDLDMVLVMGVNPGFSGQTHWEQTCEKVASCRSFLDAHGYEAMPIQVDGGVDAANIGALALAGATILVSGSAFFKYSDYAEAKEAFEGACRELTLAETGRLALAEALGWHAHD